MSISESSEGKSGSAIITNKSEGLPLPKDTTIASKLAEPSSSDPTSTMLRVNSQLVEKAVARLEDYASELGDTIGYLSSQEEQESYQARLKEVEELTKALRAIVLPTLDQ